MTAATGERERARDRAAPLHLFEACGIELEYMIVDRTRLDVAAIADRVLQHIASTDRPVNDSIRDDYGWSNELVMHVMELKNVVPSADFGAAAKRFHDEVRAMNRTLEQFDARLMPGGMHPWMNPLKETQLWPHDNASIYRAYDRIFDCRRHGWANLQATHVNLPFANDSEFAQLHAALRVIVPILPALAAASPYCDGRAYGTLDARMEAYRTNADAMPSINGEIVPEIVMSRTEYERSVLEPMYRAIAPHDSAGMLQHEWLNARGAIARFDRSAIEVRVLDTQECPHADVAFAALVVDLAESLCETAFYRVTAQAQLPTRALAEIFRACVHEADHTRIDFEEYLALFGMTRREATAGQLWRHVVERLDRSNARRMNVWRDAVEFTLTRGPLARRLLRAIGPRPSRGALHELYSALADALAENRLFDP